jgi:hypothetical protein
MIVRKAAVYILKNGRRSLLEIEMWADALNVHECRRGGCPWGGCIKFLLLPDEFFEHIGHDLRNL